MAKRIKVLEKDCYDYRIKYEKCNKALLDMASDRQSQDQYVGKASRQLSQLQKLCRTLQAERTVLVELLKTHNIERPEMPELPPEPKDIEPPPKQTDKLDIMSRNCDELKRTLAQLQTQMNSMSIEKDRIEEKTSGTKGTTATAAPANKKVKNKKAKTKAESKVNAGKAAAAKDQSPTSGPSDAKDVPPIAVSKKVLDSMDDKPLAELVTKVLAENPPPIEFLEKVLTSEVLADILNNVSDDADVAPEDTQPVPAMVADAASTPKPSTDSAAPCAAATEDASAPVQNGAANAVSEVNGAIANGTPA